MVPEQKVFSLPGDNLAAPSAITGYTQPDLLSPPMALSSKYSTLPLRSPVLLVRFLYDFLRDVHRSGKSVELLSFIIWEVQHRLRLAPRRKYVVILPGASSSVAPDSTLVTDLPGVEEMPLAWKWLVISPEGREWGVLHEGPEILYFRPTSGSLPVRLLTFPGAIKSLHRCRSGVLFLASRGVIYRSDDGVSFEPVLSLASEISWFLFNNGLAELPDGGLLLGEYGSIWLGDRWQSIAYLYRSADGGRTWEKIDSLVRRGVNKHIHVVRYSETTKSLLLTDGDNHKKLWFNHSLSAFDRFARFLPGEGWKLVNQLHLSKGGYTSAIDGRSTLLLGSDYMGGTNFIVRTRDGRRFDSRILPDPYRRAPIMNMVRIDTVQGPEIWASAYYSIGGTNRCVLLYTRDDGETWHRFLDYDGSIFAAELVSQSPGRVSYFYLTITGPSGSKTFRISR